ncbi:invasion associated locus B family protein [Georhizobium profundi]|nr:invasion associated locus B family protein [Georhizobium profundi]
MVRFKSAIKLTVMASLLSAGSAIAQINQNDGPLVAPIQPEPTVGLPEQAPAPAQPVPITPAPAATQPARSSTPPAAPPAETAEADSWQLECLERETESRLCQAILRSRVGEQIAMVLAIAKNPQDDAVSLQMALPLGIDIQRGAILTVDDFQETLMPSRCTAQGCLVETIASAELVDALMSGNAGGVRVFSTDGQTIDLPMSLRSAAAIFSEAGLD